MSDDDWETAGDDWETAGDDYDAPPSNGQTISDTTIATDATAAATDDDDEWLEPTIDKPPPSKSPPSVDPQSSSSSSRSSNPLIIVNLTTLSSGTLHSRFDRSSNNDPILSSEWKRKIESQYPFYSQNADLIAQRTVIPCSSEVFASALSRLRDELPGQYFVPVFPPTAGI
jgi:hypothetical protein